MSTWRDANWKDPGQWKHFFGFILCRIVFGRNCPHIPGIGRNFWDV